MERVGGVAPRAAQRAPGEADEHAGLPGAGPFALDREEGLVDGQHDGNRGAGRFVHAGNLPSARANQRSPARGDADDRRGPHVRAHGGGGEGRRRARCPTRRSSSSAARWGSSSLAALDRPARAGRAADVPPGREHLIRGRRGAGDDGLLLLRHRPHAPAGRRAPQLLAAPVHAVRGGALAGRADPPASLVAGHRGVRGHRADPEAGDRRLPARSAGGRARRAVRIRGPGRESASSRAPSRWW